MVCSLRPWIPDRPRSAIFNEKRGPVGYLLLHPFRQAPRLVDRLFARPMTVAVLLSGAVPLPIGAADLGVMIEGMHGVAKRYGELVALGGIDLRVPTGAVFSLLGPNGPARLPGLAGIGPLSTLPASSSPTPQCNQFGRRARSSVGCRRAQSARARSR